MCLDHPESSTGNRWLNFESSPQNGPQHFLLLSPRKRFGRCVYHLLVVDSNSNMKRPTPTFFAGVFFTGCPASSFPTPSVSDGVSASAVAAEDASAFCLAAFSRASEFFSPVSRAAEASTFAIAAVDSAAFATHAPGENGSWGQYP